MMAASPAVVSPITTMLQIPRVASLGVRVPDLAEQAEFLEAAWAETFAAEEEEALESENRKGDGWGMAMRAARKEVPRRSRRCTSLGAADWANVNDSTTMKQKAWLPSPRPIEEASHVGFGRSNTVAEPHVTASGCQAGNLKKNLKIVTDCGDSTDCTTACDQSSDSSHASSQLQEGMYAATLTSLKAWLPSPRQRQTVVTTEGSMDVSPRFVPQRVRSVHMRTASDHVQWDQSALHHSHHGGTHFSLIASGDSPQVPGSIGDNRSGGWRTGNAIRGVFVRDAHSASTLPIIDDTSDAEGECSRRVTAPPRIRRSSSLSSECIGADTCSRRIEQATYAGTFTAGWGSARVTSRDAPRPKPGAMDWMVSPKVGRPGRFAAMMSRMLKSRNSQADRK